MNKLPPRLYKFLSIKGAKNLKSAKQLLFEKKLRLSNIDHFNDPFDCAIGLKVDGVNTLEIYENTQAEVMYQAKNFGISCFSSCYDHVLMWSHYADNHKGIVVEIDPSPLKDYLFKVDYSHAYPSLKDYCDVQELGNLAALFLARKHKHWKYEKEWRLIIPRQNNTNLKINNETILKLPKDCIKGLYLGCFQNIEGLNLRMEFENITTLPSFRMDKCDNVPYKLIKREWYLPTKRINL